MEKNKTIWVFNQFAGTPSSGWGERHYYFSHFWKKEGYNVVIFSGSFNHMFNQLPVVSGRYTPENIDNTQFCWVKVPRYNPKSFFRFWSMLVFAWRLLWIPSQKYEKPASIIISSMPIFPVLSALIWRWKNPEIKVIFEIRDIWPLSLIYLGNVSNWHPAVLFIGWFEKIGYRKSNHVVSLLPNARAHVENIAQKSVSFNYIPNGIEEDLLVQEPIDESVLKHLPSGKFIIGYAGTMALANALESFIDAALQLNDKPEIHFVLVGDGYLKEELINRSQRSPNITFIPKIKKNQVQSILKYFDICFIGRNDSPLFKHGVSANKYFDYMLAGKPILDANNLIKDPVELSGCGIIVKPDSPKELANGVLSFYNMSKEERQRIGLLGHHYVKENHSIQNLAKEYLSLL